MSELPPQRVYWSRFGEAEQWNDGSQRTWRFPIGTEETRQAFLDATPLMQPLEDEDDAG